ncbi:phage tail protein [Budvicia aquatica]|uniref:phage tail protein n=1 Tax=Budvicia aquatica TaxID=82979 RepID=UPI002086227A|nr:phage tail protein [Budvicia aquatica]GKX50045.1 hypothetical protein SOASR029_03540 [Budvicia aquatica]
MTTFAEKNIVFPDGQLNVAPLPEAVMINGFTPETRDAPGMPLPAQYLNWLFRDIYRKASQLEEKTNTLNDRVIPAWMPIACPMADAPAGYLKCNGAAFDKELYPELAMGYPSGKLPDLRGEFIRGWDDGRGVDEGRAILNAQGDAIRNITGRFWDIVYQRNTGASVEGVFYMDENILNMRTFHSGEINTPTGDSIYFSADRVVPTASENRPRNIAFLYIVRAA